MNAQARIAGGFFADSLPLITTPAQLSWNERFDAQPPRVFEAALKMRLGELRSDAGVIVLMATLGIILAAHLFQNRIKDPEVR